MIAAGPHAAAEVAGYRDMWRAAPAALAERLGIAHRDVGDGLCVGCAALPRAPVFNHAFGLGLARPAGEAELDEVQAFFAGLGTPFLVAVDPAAAGLGEALARRGFGDGARPWMTFSRDPGPAPAGAGATDLAIEDAGRPRAAAFGAIEAAAFGMPAELGAWMAELVDRPGWTCLLALDGREPVGAAALFVEGDIGWFTMGATLPEHRGRGAQGALFAERLRRARALGLRRVITETGAPVGDEAPGPSYRNMLRFGFEEERLRPNLASPGWA
jgi:GNAT superfamily N-acetyltransferase